MDSTRHLLILGGATEARRLAAALHERPGLRVTSSLAGRVRNPTLPSGEVRIGGFGGADGLAEWLRRENVAAVVDATHPFAQVITANAALAHDRTGVPLLVLLRPAWRPEPGDDWHQVPSLDAARDLLPELGERVLLSTGRQGASTFADSDRWFLIRAVDPPEPPLPTRHEILLDRGPYTVDNERALLRERRIDVLVTKNSGGTMTSAKLTAARELGIPVVVVDRPPLPAAPRVNTVDDAVTWVNAQLG